MTEWITGVQAAEILGVGYSAVPKLVARGELHPRSVKRSLPSLKRGEVEQLAKHCQHELAELRARQAAVLARRTQRGRRPDDDHDWLTLTQATLLLGISRQALHARIDRGRLPFTTFGGRRWIRRDLLEQVERARAAQRTRRL